MNTNNFSIETVKSLTKNEFSVFNNNLRRFLVKTISKTGGHLASNLGVVELTVALHYVYNTPRDKIIWDVGHQSYIHKILTGRGEQFDSLRKFGGISGFPKLSESEHDAFGTGHSSTAISAALGLALARDLNNKSNHVIAVVGDGSMTGGLSFEGLNNAGRADTDLLVILNDNQMSISKNVGAMSKHLSQIRTTSGYLSAKADVHKLLSMFPDMGEPVAKGIERLKSRIKYALLQGVLFEELGFRYFGPVNGHDTVALIDILEKINKIKGPVLLHVLTKKGKGYRIAESAPGKFHGVGKFCLRTGSLKNVSGNKTYSDVFGEELVSCAEKDKRITAVTAAMPDGTGLSQFKKLYPDRFFDVGIAESHAVTFAAGLAAGGLKPLVAVYSSFLQRAYDQIIHDVCIPNLPVVFAVDRAGAVDGDGETHQGLFDMAFLSHIPGMTILAPSCEAELREMLRYGLNLNAPVAIRYPKETAPERNVKSELIHGAAEEIIKGEEIAIVSVGAVLDEVTKAVIELNKSNICPSLYNARFVKPISENFLNSLAKYKYIFTIEDGILTGGYGEHLFSVLNQVNLGQVRHIAAYPDKIPPTGTRKEILSLYELDAVSIANKIKETIRSRIE